MSEVKTTNQESAFRDWFDPDDAQNYGDCWDAACAWQREALRAAPLAPVSGAEPVAWKIKGFSGGDWITSSEDKAADFEPERVTPLYDHPQSAPLTNEGGSEPVAPFGWAAAKQGNYFTRSKSIADRIGGLIPVYAAPARSVSPAALTVPAKYKELWRQVRAGMSKHHRRAVELGFDGISDAIEAHADAVSLAAPQPLAINEGGKGEVAAFSVDVSDYAMLLETTAEAAEAQAAHFRARGHAVTVTALAPIAAPQPSARHVWMAQQIRALESALVYVGHAMHAEPQYMCAKGVILIDNDAIEVRMPDGSVVAARQYPNASTAPQPSASPEKRCNCRGAIGGHSRTCPAFDESMMRYDPFSNTQPVAINEGGKHPINWYPADSYDPESTPVSSLNEGGKVEGADYEAVLSDHRRMVRELDVLLNGEAGAAKQASLCDIVSQVRRTGTRIAAPQPSAKALADERTAFNNWLMGNGEYAHWSAWLAWQARALLAAEQPSEDKRDSFAVLRTGFKTTRVCGPDSLYEINIKFRNIDDLHAADDELRAAIRAAIAKGE